MRTLVKRSRGVGILGLFVLLGLAAAACVRPGERIEPPTVRLVDLELAPGGTLEQRLVLDLLIENPNDFDLSIDGMRMRLDLNGQPLGRALGNERVRLPRLSETRVRVGASVTLFDVALQLLRLGAREGVDYELEGDLFLTAPSSTTLGFRRSGSLLPAAAR